MAAGSHFTPLEVCDMIAGEEGDDAEFLFPGSDDDFDAGMLEDEYDPLDREQGK